MEPWRGELLARWRLTGGCRDRIYLIPAGQVWPRRTFVVYFVPCRHQSTIPPLAPDMSLEMALAAYRNLLRSAHIAFRGARTPLPPC